MAKELYHGEFNINAEVTEEFAYAHSEGHALVEMARRIAANKGVLPGMIISYLRHHPHSYEIKLEKSSCKKSSEYMQAGRQQFTIRDGHTMSA